MKVNVDCVEKEDTPEQKRSGEAKGYIGFQEVMCHIIFDIKMDFSINDRMVSKRAMTEAT